MSWDEKKIQILKENWGKLTASAIAEKIVGTRFNLYTTASSLLSNSPTNCSPVSPLREAALL